MRSESGRCRTGETNRRQTASRRKREYHECRSRAYNDNSDSNSSLTAQEQQEAVNRCEKEDGNLYTQKFYIYLLAVGVFTLVCLTFTIGWFEV